MMMKENKKQVTLKINGVEVEAQEGTTILDVANKLGIEIPTLCNHPALSTFGSCRVCSVEITAVSYTHLRAHET